MTNHKRARWAGDELTWAPRIARLVVLAILIGIGISHVVFAIRDWPLGDMDVYLEAARRLREGEPLYLDAGGSPEGYWEVAAHAYWYAPWFAVVWIPLTYVPRDLLAVLWSGILILGTAAVVVLLARQGRFGVVLALLVGPPLIAVSAGGNVQSLMLLALVAGINRPWGPLAVGAAASLKLTPILLVAAYVARREWWKAAATTVIAVTLLLPGYLMGSASAGVELETAPSLLGVSPILYAIAVLAAVALAFFVPHRHAMTAAAAAAVLALPRLFVYDVTLAAAGAARPAATDERPPPSA